MKIKLQPDWFDVWYLPTIEFVSHNEFLGRMQQLRSKGLSVRVLEVKPGGYALHTEQAVKDT